MKKKNAPVLSLEQKRAKEAYLKAYTSAYLVSMAVLMFSMLVLEYFFSPTHGSGNSSSIAGGCPVTALVLANFLAIRKVRAAGLSLESPTIETIDHLKCDAVGDAIEWRYPKTFLGSLVNVGGWLLLSAAAWWAWHWAPLSWSIQGLAMLSFFLYFFFGLTELIFFRAPHVHIDEDKIIGFQKQWWRRRARWSDIARCDITHRHNCVGQGLMRTFTFRASNGDLLLRLNPVSFQGLSRDEQAEIEREIRRRLGHAEPDDVGQTLSNRG